MTDDRAAAVELERVSVAYRDTTALRDVSLRISAGETVALLGPSGSGKSTALKAIAGFEAVSSGTVRLGGRDVTGLPPAERGIGIVVQSYALFPHQRVRDNVAFGLAARRVPRRERAERVAAALAMVGMSDFADRYPAQLSGGQQQRVAIARALAPRPRVLLLDEPLSALDARLRESMLEELQRLRSELPDVAMLYVTHDQSEALALADRIAIMRDGVIVDIDAAEELYTRPPSVFTATFLGGANILEATVVEAGASSECVELMLCSDRLSGRSLSRRVPGERVLVSVRPHAIAIGAPGAEPGLAAEIESVVWRGSAHHVRARLASGASVTVIAPLAGARPRVGDAVSLLVRREDVHLLDEKPGAGVMAAAGVAAAAGVEAAAGVAGAAAPGLDARVGVETRAGAAA
ncbi:ABC transporter ATP-binding protein [Leifsonia sp. TF02-11]|uniref:ABC transporter ATP-binding protein n=1 Tax=Leifsonia sp. TF02-11 TaxID=2815212 RepID=UPI001AA180B2|nr:ABC transporter ATP-binding protein [Leifsonia sp. TF02-11]MBO1741829.1 ABC transporter ATP-binding protein [Leifsonia sp. TF02-11]